MKVFISWSGERSKAVAEALHDWLPKVIQAVRPFVSTNSIDKGTRWRSVLADEMEQSRFGIVCLTPENLTASWILFEAGALSKLQQDSVCTYLFGLESADVGDPLSQFQATRANKDDTKKLVRIIYDLSGNSSLTETQFDETFDVWWPKLEERLLSIPIPQQGKDPKRTERELLEDILTTVRITQRERDLSGQVNDSILLQYMTLLRAVAESDPKLKFMPEFQIGLGQLEDKISLSKYASERSWGSSYLRKLAESLSKEEQTKSNERRSGVEVNSIDENINP